jgi:hypothetical protein
VSVLTLFGVLTIPDIVREGSDFVQRLKAENVWVVVLEKLRHGIGCAPACQTVPAWLLMACNDVSEPAYSDALGTFSILAADFT